MLTIDIEKIINNNNMYIEKLTLQEKIQVYEKALSTFEGRVKFFEIADKETLKPGICSELVSWLIENKRNIVMAYGLYGMEQLLKDVFPELFEFEPHNKFKHGFWFDLSREGNQQRVDLINKILKQLN
jgi:hypothetical protein